METIRTPEAMQRLRGRLRAEGRRIGFVPTMGALHEGHLSLMRRCRAESEVAVWSLFVNPTQFGPQEDLAAYPRDPEGDMRKAARVGMDVCFAPEMESMYAPVHQTTVEVGALSASLCGASRPGHFRGVATVVCKLFHIVQPHVAYFGQKDYQQSLVIRRMVRDLNFDLEITVLPTVREADGLALSSRNAYLTPPQREAAASLWAALRWAEEQFAGGERDAATLVEGMRQRILAQRVAEPVIDYVEVRDAETLEPVHRVQRSAVAALAVKFGGTRLIDNTLLTP